MVSGAPPGFRYAAYCGRWCGKWTAGGRRELEHLWGADEFQFSHCKMTEDGTIMARL